MKKDELKQNLHNFVCEIVFTKKDGTERTLIGTTKSEFLKEDDHSKVTIPKSENPNNVKVFDLAKQSWRSFNIDTLKSFKILGENYVSN